MQLEQDAGLNEGSGEEFVADNFGQAETGFDPDAPDAEHVSAEHIPQQLLERSYKALYRNISHWVRQAEELTNVPRTETFEESMESNNEDTPAGVEE
ncbi:hypothetical protein [Paenibacillus sp. DMB20]|uniref:hypothetical protein n=1 Tax=Paenibacillus sp. DMB20 TaxID=1642570 RepID=UPI000627CA9A|nr:hypothetical protein [Paenibacillus sp. DMB20]KKO53404.1 hypothetical protein XI25_14045 [Paenibacillus sp. DMB20]